MNKSRMRRVISLLLIITMLFSGSSIVALATEGGSHANTDTKGIEASGGGSKPGNSNGASINYYGGGYKISYAIMDRHI